jgi:hypothetical protein
MNHNVEKNSYLIITDNFDIKHLIKITNLKNINPGSYILYGGIVIKSLEESNLNTINFTKESIEMCFSEKPNVDTLEEVYPELWI